MFNFIDCQYQNSKFKYQDLQYLKKKRLKKIELVKQKVREIF